MKRVNFILNLTSIDEFQLKDYKEKCKDLNLNFLYEDYNDTRINKIKKILNKYDNKGKLDSLNSIKDNNCIINLQQVIDILKEYSNKEGNQKYSIKISSKFKQIFIPFSSSYEYIGNNSKIKNLKSDSLKFDFDYRKKYAQILNQSNKKIDKLFQKEIYTLKSHIQNRDRECQYIHEENPFSYRENQHKYKNQNYNNHFTDSISHANMNFVDKNINKIKIINSNHDNDVNEDMAKSNITNIKENKNIIIDCFDDIFQHKILKFFYKKESFNIDMSNEIAEYNIKNENNLKNYSSLIINNVLKNIKEDKKSINNTFLIYGPEASGKSAFLRGEKHDFKDGFMIHLIKSLYRNLNLLKNNKEDQLILKFGSILLTKGSIVNLIELNKNKSFFDEIHIESMRYREEDTNFNLSRIENLGIKNDSICIKHLDKIEDINNEIYQSIKKKKSYFKNQAKISGENIKENVILYHFSLETKNFGKNLNNKKSSSLILDNSSQISSILNKDKRSDLLFHFQFFEINTDNLNDSNNIGKIKDKIEFLINQKSLLEEYPSLENVLFKNKMDSEYIHFILNLINYKNFDFEKYEFSDNDKRKTIDMLDNIYIDQIISVNDSKYFKNLINSLKVTLYFKGLLNRKELIYSDKEYFNVDEVCDRCLRIQKNIFNCKQTNKIFEEEIKKMQKEIIQLEIKLINLKKLREKLNMQNRFNDFNKLKSDQISLNIPKNQKNNNDYLASDKNNENQSISNDLDEISNSLIKNSIKLEKQLNTLNKLFVQNKIKSENIDSRCQDCSYK